MSSVGDQQRLYSIIKGPHVSEKTSLIAEAGKLVQVTFKVARDATKKEIKRAVQNLFKVEVDRVHTVNVKGKTRRVGNRFTKRQSWKKAYVVLKEGCDIDFTGFGQA